MIEYLGYKNIVNQLNLEVAPLASHSEVWSKSKRSEEANIKYFPKSYDPGENVLDHLEFALKYESLNIPLILQAFKKMGPTPLVEHIKNNPTGQNTRRLWFLYEFLIDLELKITQPEELSKQKYISLLDEGEYFTGNPVNSPRHKIKNNLLGNKQFCPTVRRTDEIEKYIAMDLRSRAKDVLEKFPKDVILRVVQYLYTKETKSSYEIEREQPSKKREARFSNALQEASKRNYLKKRELIELQNLIVAQRYANSDYRKEQIYVGESIGYREEKVHYICPKPNDIESLMQGLIKYGEALSETSVPPVVAAATIAFGFVFIHPFDDGNGRIHRFLIHNVLALSEYAPNDLVFPVSATMLKYPKVYDSALESFSSPLLTLIEYKMSEEQEMTVEGETIHHYEYPEMTKIVESLFYFVEKTIGEELEGELNFMLSFKACQKDISTKIDDMPNRKLDNLIHMIIGNNGTLSKKKRTLYKELTEDEIQFSEQNVASHFDLPKE
jgi:hypothetical protein